MDTNPYTTPSSTDTPEQAGVRGPYGAFRNNGALKSTLVSLLVVDAMLIIFNSGVLNYLDMKQAESDAYWLSDEPSKLDEIITLAGGAHALISILIVIIFAVWINRSCKNAWLLDAPRMRTTPGWSVGYYFIPILNLWKPYGAMKEIRAASFGNDHALRSILPTWWTFWIISGILGQIVFRLYLDIENGESYLMACKLDLVSVPIDIILNYLAITLVMGITRAQHQRASQWRA